ncbi:MAG: Putative thioredoxin family protein [Leptospirillum sp. Group II 'C75']|uniref:Thioredoxin family protein n=1 Tax=Leptospirillum ferriphilum TaxID=178606 RepID=A0A1V3SV20_9BACT|nr:thioredoxin family protein [Leptospirillum sp. Group II 'CF-1']EAY56292.1 MAG: putative thioredoxin family protein [Leptospirillum rubarum]EIJ76983.1 MAG: Putative thioredoxin family protein [Leptospirillum sp. Group II 'C75']OOH71288.1 thioredoxin family protein [Leptospirillum ferriphilum]
MTLNRSLSRTGRGSFFSFGIRLAAFASLFAILMLGEDQKGWGSGLPGVPEDLFQKMGFIVFDDREKAPDVTGPSVSGGNLDLGKLRGRWVLLNFWATWCVPCRQEIPTLVRLSRQIDGRKVVLLSVAMDTNPAKIRHYLKKTPVDYPVLLGQESHVDGRYIGMGLPETYLIDPKGYLVGKAAGSRDWSGPASMHLFDALENSPSGMHSPRKDPS